MLALNFVLLIKFIMELGGGRGCLHCLLLGYCLVFKKRWWSQKIQSN